MRRPISVKREHPAEPMIPDVSTTTGTNSKSADPGFRMVKYRLLVENESCETIILICCLCSLCDICLKLKDIWKLYVVQWLKSKTLSP